MPNSRPMTPKRRWLASVLGGRVDRPSTASVTSVANVEQMVLTDAFFPEAHVEGVTMARLAAGAHDILGFDAIMPYFSVHAESAALGCDVDWRDPYSMPVSRSTIWSDPDEVAMPADFFEKPPVKAILDAIAILQQQYGHRVAIVGKVMGPWTLAYHTYGIQSLLLETYTDPEKVRRFLDRLKEITVSFGLAQIHAGADALCLADHATGDLVGPWTYRDFLLPVHKKLTRRMGCPLVLHTCGSTLDRIGLFAQAGFNCFHFDSKIDAQDAVKEASGRISLMGNVNNPEVLLNGTPALVTEQVRYALSAGVQVVGPDCAVSPVTPLENLLAITQAADRGL